MNPTESIIGSNIRFFNLPETANPEAIEGQYTDGILTVSIPKREAELSKAPKQISLK